MYAVSEAFQRATLSSHQVRVQATLLRGGKVVVSELPFVSGSVRVDGSAFVRRQLTLTLPPTIKTGLYASALTRELVRTTGDEIRLRWGLVFPGGSVEWVPLGVFRVDSVPQNSTGSEVVSVRAVDRCSDVVDDLFLQVRTFEAGSTTSLIAQLLRETSPSASVINQTTVRDARVPVTQVDGSRSEFIRQLADSIGAVVYCNGFGDFVIADAAKLTDQAVYTLKTGVGGNIVEASSESTRAGVHNQIIMRGQSPSGDFQPVQETVADDDPSSPTRYGDRLAGRFGKVPLVLDSSTITSLGQAQAAARAELAKRVGISSAMSIQSVPLVFLEPGDSVLVIPDDVPAAANARKHIVDSWDLDLSAGGSFSLSTRDVREVNL